MKDNKLISEFMGASFNDEGMTTICGKFGLERVSALNLRYHDSWDWLMPAVEKIEGLRDTNGNAYRFTIDMCNAQIEGTHIEVIGGSCKLDTTYKAVVGFINQLNR